MRKFVIALFTVVALGTAAGALEAANPRHKYSYSLNKAHKQQRKQLKEQQRAVKQTMSRHPLSSDARRSLNRELKAQKKALHNQQKSESRMLEAGHKSAARNRVKVAKSSP